MKARANFALFAGAALAVTIAIILFSKDRTDEQMRALGAPLADSLAAYIRAHHACPPTLEAIGLASPSTKFGPFTYRTWDGGAKCQISVGVYARDGFEDYWQFPPGDWYSNR